MDNVCDDFFDDRKDFITYVKEAIGQTKYEVKFKKLDERAVIPTYAHDGDVGMDMTAIDMEYDFEHDMYIYHTGLAFETDKHYGMFLFPRSSNRKTDAYLCNHVGIVDVAIYRGEIIFCFKNRTSLETRYTNKILNNFLTLCEQEPLVISTGNGVEFNLINIIRKARRAEIDPYEYAPYKVGDRIGQMVIMPYPNISLIERKELSETDRGANGFGSTDEKK